jgi:hypothetical protein
MAEMQPTPKEKHHKAGVNRSKKLSTRVDLGFLLITFFIFTTSLSKPKALGLILPSDSRDSISAPAGLTLNLILGADNKVFYYEGDEVWKANCTNFSAKGVRSVIQAGRKGLWQKG